ncbi:anti-sigma-I factor RsgI2-like [Onthophagus taurus]|uniref:anti-sigma-I factor RsgI2-like n=1 Tax=Onthophagus taurus TaxID=166361 RepID=UPI000C20FA9E|nr:merozoite surface protein CMZ-8-like [Onthophagus taurus]
MNYAKNRTEEYVQFICNTSTPKLISLDQIKQNTDQDETLQALKMAIRTNDYKPWQNLELKPYSKIKEEITLCLSSTNPKQPKPIPKPVTKPLVRSTRPMTPLILVSTTKPPTTLVETSPPMATAIPRNPPATLSTTIEVPLLKSPIPIPPPTTPPSGESSPTSTPTDTTSTPGKEEIPITTWKSKRSRKPPKYLSDYTV